jgi:hypothetical protein
MLQKGGDMFQISIFLLAGPTSPDQLFYQPNSHRFFDRNFARKSGIAKSMSGFVVPMGRLGAVGIYPYAAGRTEAISSTIQAFCKLGIGRIACLQQNRSQVSTDGHCDGRSLPFFIDNSERNVLHSG